uniref:Pancreatic trypsin inhibitor n=1 Tax=Rhipicephalus zambeziensis TaxID=60191 RepID=A0A224Y1X6_9ACAR
MKRTSFVALQLACVIHVHGFLEANTQTHACMEPRDPGHCRASVPMWYFDAYERMCKKFIYGGCQGNKNRFETKAACEATCSRLKTKTGPCTQEPVTGPCRAYILSWYFDKKHHACKLFVYGGCHGNANRFASEKECETTCMPQSSPKGICSLDPMTQRCHARAQLWYFDPLEDTCHRFPRGFCGGSANRFATCEKCMKRCSRANPFKTCSLAYRKIHYGKQGIHWPGKTEPRVRGPGVIAPGHPLVQDSTRGVPGESGTMQGGTGAPALIAGTPTATAPWQGGNGFPGPVAPPTRPGGSLSNNSGQGGPLIGAQGPPGYTTAGAGSRGSGLGESVLVVPLPSPSAVSGTNAQGLEGSFSGRPYLPPPTLTHPRPTGTVLQGQPGTGPSVGLPTPTRAGAHKPRITTGVATGITAVAAGVPTHEIISSGTSATTLMSSSVSSRFGQPAPFFPPTTALAAVHAGSTAGAAMERGSNLTLPPLTIPPQFL